MTDAFWCAVKLREAGFNTDNLFFWIQEQMNNGEEGFIKYVEEEESQPIDLTDAFTCAENLRKAGYDVKPLHLWIQHHMNNVGEGFITYADADQSPNEDNV